MNMIDYIKYFFRSEADSIPFKSFGLVHFLLILLALIGCLVLIMNKEKLKETKISRVLEKNFLYVLVCQQLILYSWYAFSGNLSNEALPLYHCRIAIIFTIISFITNKKSFKIVASYWGLVGSALALFFLGLDPYLFPHYTVFSYFIGHIVLLWSSIYFFITGDIIADKESLKELLIFTNIYNINVYIFNYFKHTNYSYLSEPPFLKEVIFSFISPISYTVGIILFFNLIMSLVYKILQKIYIVNNKKQYLFKIHVNS